MHERSRGFGPDDLLACYRRGIFPMADDREARSLYLMEPEFRAIIPLDIEPSKSMRKFMRKTSLNVSFNRDFPAVIDACATSHGDTWISYGIEALYTVLHHGGDAHSVEVWDGETLVGGLYGVTQGGAFFGESMFSRATNASKLALFALISRLRAQGFVLLDAQFMTDHLASLGAQELSRERYKAQLEDALKIDAKFDAPLPA